MERIIKKILLALDVFSYFSAASSDSYRRR